MDKALVPFLNSDDEGSASITSMSFSPFARRQSSDKCFDGGLGFT
jgi:hypothetical protein